MATATLLSSERDSNFRMNDAQGGSFLLKISNAAEDSAITHLQTQALQYLRDRCPQLPVPRLIASRDGKEELRLTLASGTTHIVRLMSFLPGYPASTIPRSRALRLEAFRTLAELDMGLRGFKPSASHDLLWDVSRAGRVRPLLDAIGDDRVRNAALSSLACYERDVSERLEGLRRQIIHNDFNPNNILLSGDEPRVTGIIDFGDLIEAPLIGDLATGAAYQIIGVEDPIEALGECASAYHERFPLTVDELVVLFDLVLARLVLIVTITEWRARHHPDNRTYILRNTPGAAHLLTQLAAVPRADVTRLLRETCRI